MQTDFSTVEIYFVFAFTYCKLRVYKEEENFARRILETQDVEFLDESENDEWQEIDTRILLNLVRESLTPELLLEDIAEAISDAFKKIKGS